MYRITLANGGDIAVVDAVRYIKVGEMGSFTTAAAEDATGVAVNGAAYSLFGHDEIDAPAVLVSYVDGGVFAAQAAQNAANIDYISAMTGIDLPIEEEEPVAEPNTAEEEAE